MTVFFDAKRVQVEGLSFQLLLALIFGCSFSTAASAQGVDDAFANIERIQKQAPALQRAMNLARAKAISLNGGLRKYMPEKCMFSTKLVRQGCLVHASEAGFVFRFSGGQPGWEVTGLPPEIITEVEVSPNGRSVLQASNEFSCSGLNSDGRVCAHQEEKQEAYKMYSE